MLTSEYSEAGTLVMVRDAGGAVWRYLGNRDGTVGELRIAETAEDGGGAMAGTPSHSGREDTTTTKRGRFAKRETGAELRGNLTPGRSSRHVVNAEKGRDLYVRVVA